MNIKTILAAAAITAGTIFAPGAAQAQETPGMRNLWNAIKTAGVTITVDDCDNDAMGWFEHHPGSYQNMAIQVCTNSATTFHDRWETLRHEAVHLAQKCENPQHGHQYETLTSMDYLQNNVSGSDWEFIKSSYPREKWVIEAEAFTLMRYDNQTIANVVNEACN